MDLSCVILAGGRGSRLGRDKTRIVLGGKSLFQRVLDGISFLNSEVIVVTSGEESCPWLGYPWHRVVVDIYPAKGPLGGIFTGLTASSSLYSLVVACDMPFLNQSLLSYMVEIAADFDLVLPRLGNMIEPLHAIYSRHCVAPIEHLINQGSLSIRRLLSMVKVRYVDSDEISRFDPEHLSFFNVNTEADLETARALVSRGERNDNG